VAAADLKPGTSVAVSLRPHAITLRPVASRSEGGTNLLRGRIERATYLGDAVDYEVTIEASDVRLRVTTLPGLGFRPGEAVLLEVPATACVPLADAGD
jgi:ABC-type Fe3+/spermidine/putrescine transport system ATPase subunit